MSFNKLDIYAKIGDMKEVDYRNTLAIATIIELLIDRGIITREDFAKKAYHLDTISTQELKNLRK